MGLNTLLVEVWVCAARDGGELLVGGEDSSLVTPSSPDSSVTGDSRVWQRPAVTWRWRQRGQDIRRQTDRGREAWTGGSQWMVHFDPSLPLGL